VIDGWTINHPITPEIPVTKRCFVTRSYQASEGEVGVRKSQCEPFRAQITSAREAGLSAQRIYQDLVNDHRFAGSYDAVKHFVRKLGAAQPLPFRRMETEPGQEAQVDFGQGAWIVEEGRRRRPHVLRVVLAAISAMRLFSLQMA
jgi:hypothetical protein